MPKNKHKKQKTRHHLTDAEIWDDSALIQSWDEAVAEYEHYHSIHATGEDVEELLRRREREDHGVIDGGDDGLLTPATTTKKSTATEEDVEDGEIDDDDDDDDGEVVESKSFATAEAEEEQVEQDPAEIRNGFNHPHHPTPITDPDQILENIKMAYWWSGYYSGLYEGHQQQQQQQQQHKTAHRS